MTFGKRQRTFDANPSACILSMSSAIVIATCALLKSMDLHGPRIHPRNDRKTKDPNLANVPSKPSISSKQHGEVNKYHDLDSNSLSLCFPKERRNPYGRPSTSILLFMAVHMRVSYPSLGRIACGLLDALCEADWFCLFRVGCRVKGDKGNATRLSGLPAPFRAFPSTPSGSRLYSNPATLKPQRQVDMASCLADKMAEALHSLLLFLSGIPSRL